MSKTVVTKMHQIIERSKGEVPIFNEMARSPLYFLDQKLIKICENDEVMGKSVAALILSGNAHLPHPRLVVEFDGEAYEDRPGQVRRLFYIRQVGDEFRVHGTIMTYERLSLQAEFTLLPIMEGEGYMRCTERGGNDNDTIALGAFSILMMFLTLDARGVKKEAVEVERLNRKRENSGRTPIPSHTVIRIGSYFDRNGREHRIGGSHTMSIHLRAGHMRNQAYGKGRALRKSIYIPPTIVNYQPDAEIPVPMRVVKA